MKTWTKWTTDKKAKLLELLQAGNTLTAACEAIGISYSTVKRQRRKYPRFDKEVRTAMETQVVMVADALYQQAVSGNVTAQIFFLVNRTKFWKPEEKWQHVQHVRHGGDAEAPPIKTEASSAEPDWSRLTVEELHVLRELRRKATEGPQPERNGAESPTNVGR